MNPHAYANFRVFTQLVFNESAPEAVNSFDGPDSVFQFVRRDLESSERERMIAVYVDTKMVPIGVDEIAVGGIDSTTVYPANVARTALLCNARSVFVAHNHPSGDPQPSPEDLRVTKTIRDALALFEIPLRDHIIVGHKGRYVSLCEKNQI